MNTLYYGDNLEILRKHIADDSVDLIYLDPPFNSNRDYNVLFKEQSGEPAQAQMKAFTDTWKWSEAAYADFRETCPRDQLVKLVQGFVDTLGRNDVTAYLVMMAPRLVELRRVLKPTGSLYLHCDPTASHYLKLVLDAVFGPKGFLGEIIWRRTTSHVSARRWPRLHDVILSYASDPSAAHFAAPKADLDEGWVEREYRYQDEHGRYMVDNLTGAGTTAGPSGQPWRGIDPASIGSGRHWRYVPETLDRLDAEGRIHWPAKGQYPKLKVYAGETGGKPIGDLWMDISLGRTARERLGYPTQKPLALLERIISASSYPGNVVLDPFCGCGTAVIAAQKLGRQWLGIDVTALAVALIKSRLADSFDVKEKKDYAVVGEPTSEADARALALKDRDEFQKWAVGLVPRAFPFQEKKGADTGVDGVLRFKDDARDPKRCVIQVKSGHVGHAQARDFRGVIEREGATLGLFITLEPPTTPMLREADSLGFYVTPLGNHRIPRFQFRTIAQLLAGEGFLIPSAALLLGVKQAQAVKGDSGQQEMDL
ncbi:MAG: restriction endonuclease [Armatimonadetes bacterium]|nr:restriction endonuclease [Armatimonadota bacterium]